MIAGISGMFAGAVGDSSRAFSAHRNSDQVRRGLSATKKYSVFKKLHANIGSRTRGAVQLRERAYGVHWRQA